MEETIDTEGLMLWLPRNISNYWLDLSGEVNHGIIYGATIAASLCEQCMSFNGAGNYVNCGSTTNPGIDGSMTVEVWMNIPSTALTGYRAIIAKEDAADRTFLVDLNNGRMDAVIGVTSLPNAPTQLLPEIWNHLVYVLDSSDDTFKYYLNNKLDLTVTPAPSLENSLADLWIGARGRSSGDLWFLGEMGELRIYNRVLASEEIRRSNEITKKYYGY